ncbi:MAG TPA: nitrilase-related carbon-nitrogen hydrolase [Luteimonas sp.]|nr:nitrilase-related carbon-nitrogen hydrolase [Luteimonas sp.]
MTTLRNLALAVGAGVLLHFSLMLEPAWWAGWLAPLPLLLLAFRAVDWRGRLWVAAAILGGTATCLPYFHLVMPWPAAVAAWLGQSLAWWFVTMATRRVVLACPTPWAMFAYPVLWVAVDTLMAALLPDGNWGSLAYSQAGVLPLLQVASLAGVAGMLFLLCLPASAMAVVLRHRREPWRRQVAALVVVAALLVGAVGFGAWRLRQPLQGVPVRVGLASIDDAVGVGASPAYAIGIRDRYDALVGQLADSGAQLVLLPEKIAVLRPAGVAAWQAHFGRLAASHDLWLEVGIGVDDGRHPRNYAWLFDPSGRRVEDYEKHRLAPPERAAGYAAGSAWSLHRVDGHQYGIAICKDMHFATLGREYGRRGADLMLVPAWDFAYVDGWMASRMTLVRGVESGYGIVRAAREGLLTASDAPGRVLAEAASAPMPGSLLLATLPVGQRVQTVYSRTGDLFGWLCVVLGAACVLMRRRSGGTAAGRG